MTFTQGGFSPLPVAWQSRPFMEGRGQCLGEWGNVGARQCTPIRMIRVGRVRRGGLLRRNWGERAQHAAPLRGDWEDQAATASV